MRETHDDIDGIGMGHPPRRPRDRMPLLLAAVGLVAIIGWMWLR